MVMQKLTKLHKGDKVAILSPSFAAPGKWPHVYELGLKRLKEIFELEPVEFPATKKIGASKEERSKDLVDAFTDKSIKAVIASLGGNDQVTYIKDLPSKPFVENPKPFFGYSDSTHFHNFLWLSGIPSFYGGHLFTQFAIEGKMDDFTVQYLKHALFDQGEFELQPGDVYNDVGLNWSEPENLLKFRSYEPNEGWFWDINNNNEAEGITWGGCLESIDEMLRHGIKIPSLTDFENLILITETSEELPDSDYVFRVFRALGERGILEKLKGVLVGRPKAWEFGRPIITDKKAYRAKLRETTIKTVRSYNQVIPIVQNLDFGHTEPQIPMPYGGRVRINSEQKQIFAEF